MSFSVKISNPIRRFGHDKKGVAAVEFAIVGPLFLVLIMSLMELGWTMTKIALVDHAVSQAAKFVYIGAAAKGTPTQKEIGEYICDTAKMVSNCEKNIAVELTVLDEFTKPPTWNAPCNDAKSKKLAPTVNYNPGSASEIVFMRVCIVSDVFTPGFGMGLALKNTETDRLQIVASTVFMNEPFQ